MPLPDFTDDERYLVTSVKSPTARAGFNSYMWGYLLGGSLVAGFAVLQESIMMMFAAFTLVCVFRVYEEHLQSKWAPLWRTILEKYEAAALATGAPASVFPSEGSGRSES